MMGTAIHKLLEESGKGEIGDSADLDRCFDQILQDIEKRTAKVSSHLFPLKRTIADYEVRRIRAFDKAKEIIEARKQPTVGAVTTSDFEVWLCSLDGQVGGYVDELKNCEDGTSVRDFKTGAIVEQTEEGQTIKEAYAVQLKLYAALFAETSGNFPVRLELVPLQGQPVEVPFSPEECRQLLDTARNLLQTINLRVESEDYLGLSSPSPANCGFCAYRPICPVYLQTIEACPAEFVDKIGKLESVGQLRNGTMLISIKVASGELVHLRGVGLNGNTHPALQNLTTGDRVGLFNIAKAGDGSFVETKLTTIYQYQANATV